MLYQIGRAHAVVSVHPLACCLVLMCSRAEHVGMMFQPKVSDSVPNMHADLNMLLSLCSQGLLPSIAAPVCVATPLYPIQIGSPPYASPHPSSYSEKTPMSAYLGLPPSMASPVSPPPSPQYAEHVGTAPSHMSPPSSILNK